ncbi:DUF6747 family protein [Maribacter polysaccharolyticus]|uniref:DUF6747 family protein n=1 Tax=Maribacter polysaccharolyticus TaxID=3020831 RepID=UPI00308419B1
MKTFVLVREIYLERFRNIQNYLLKYSFKAFTWFTIAMFAVVLYAFLYRLSTDFQFSNL